MNKIHDLKHPVLGHKIEWRDKDHTDIRISIEFERARLRAAAPVAAPSPVKNVRSIKAAK